MLLINKIYFYFQVIHMILRSPYSCYSWCPHNSPKYKHRSLINLVKSWYLNCSFIANFSIQVEPWHKMKVKRHKHVRKVLTFYQNNFSLKAPYHVLVDGTFCRAALTCQVNIQEQMPKYLEAETKLYTTPCVLKECESFGKYTLICSEVLRYTNEIIHLKFII